MTAAQTKPEWQRAVIALSAAVVFAMVVGAVYWARSIFIPVALAVFLTFVLSPVVHRLERWRFPRLPAVLGTVSLALTAFGLIGWLVTWQLSELTEQLPEKTQQIAAKLAEVRGMVVGGGDSEIGRSFEEIRGAVFPSESPAGPATLHGDAHGAVGGGMAMPTARADQPAAVPVRIQSAEGGSTPYSSWIGRVEGLISPVMEIFGQTAFAFVLSVFMLLKREDLRNRLIRLIGPTQITTTTKAVDDASRRVSRYLLAQLMLNTAFGGVITVAMLLIGVPYPFVWGVLAACMRYVPYLGTWIGLFPPLLVSFALSDGWTQPLMVLAVYGGLELICNNVFEPWLYGSSMGLSEVAQLVAAAFWTFLWGPIGLILSGPLTVCLLVLGKYVPQFQFLEVLLGDEPALSPEVRFYQRLMARDEDEASAILAEQLAGGADPVAVADTVLVPALSRARQDVDEGVLSREDGRMILQAMRELNDEVADAVRHDPSEGDGEPVRILALPARDEVDRVGMEILRGLLGPSRWEVEVAAAESLTSELMDRVAAFRPMMICVAALPPGGLAHTRYLCKRLRRQFPDVHIVVGRWGLAADVEENRKQLKDAGADHVTASMDETKQYLRGWRPALDTEQKAAGIDGGKSNGRRRVGTPAAF